MMKGPGSSQAFCLKLNSHQSHMIESFQKLYNEEVMVDCTISCAGGTLKAHKLVLSACSPYFTSLFSTFTNPYQYPVVVIKDMPFPDLKAIIEFMYRGEVTVPQSILPSVLESAKTLSITGLSDIKIANFDQNPGSSPSAGNANNSKPLADLFAHNRSNRNAGKRNRRKARRNSRDAHNNETNSEDGILTDDGSNDEENVSVKQMRHDQEPDARAGSNTTAPGTEVKKDQDQQSEQMDEYEADEEEDEDDMDGNVAMELAGVVSGEAATGDEDGGNVLTPVASSSSHSQAGHQPTKQSPFGIQRLTPSASLKQDLRQQRIQKLQQQTGGLSGRKMWSDEEVRTLVRIWEEESARVWASAGKKVLSLKKISDLLQDEGIDRDISQVEGKIKALKRDYKAVKFDKAIPSVQTRMAPFLERLDKIFDHDTDL